MDVHPLGQKQTDLAPDNFAASPSPYCLDPLGMALRTQVEKAMRAVRSMAEELGCDTRGLW